MKMTIIGGGPGGFFAGLLCKKAKPDWDIEIFERNKADDTFGFGVVFSDETLDEFLSRDKAVHNNIRNEFAYWDDVAIHYKGKEIRILEMDPVVQKGIPYFASFRTAVLNLA